MVIWDCFTLIGLETSHFLKQPESNFKSVSLQVVFWFLPSVLPFLRGRFNISFSSDWLLESFGFCFTTLKLKCALRTNTISRGSSRSGTKASVYWPRHDNESP